MDVKELLKGLLNIVEEIEKKSQESQSQTQEIETQEVEGLEGKASSGA